MPTSVHIPKVLLDAVDRRARTLRLSRNQLIIRALEREMKQVSDWSPGFLETLAAPAEGTREGVDAMMEAIRKGRRSKAPITL